MSSRSTEDQPAGDSAEDENVPGTDREPDDLVDQDSLSILYKKGQRSLFSFFMRNGVREAVASEFVQEVFARYSRTPRQDIRSPMAYLMRIARNLLLERRARVAEELVGSTERFDEIQRSKDLTPPPDDYLVSTADFDFFHKAVEALPMIEKAVLALSIAGKTYQQIAEHSGTKPDEVRIILARARGRLERLFDPPKGRETQR